MPIHRTNKKESGRFFVAPNGVFNDSRLSWEARGLMGYLLSKPDKWIVREQDLIKQGSAGKHKIKKILAELKQNGYIKKTRHQNDQGRFEWITDIYDAPQDQSQTTTRKSGDGSTAQKSGHGSSTTTQKSGDGPYTDLPVDGKPSYGTPSHGESGHIVNTDGVNTDLVNTDLINTDGGRATTRKSGDGIINNAAAAAEKSADMLLNALKNISAQMPKPLQVPKALVKTLLNRGENAQTTTNAWKTCQANAYKPAGAFICWIKSGYLPQQPSSFNSKKRATPPSSAPPPPPEKDNVLQEWRKRRALVKQVLGESQ